LKKISTQVQFGEGLAITQEILLEAYLKKNAGYIRPSLFGVNE
jgi:hypothetical protein